jgi:hypothetical protein
VDEEEGAAEEAAAALRHFETSAALGATAAWVAGNDFLLPPIGYYPWGGLLLEERWMCPGLHILPYTAALARRLAEERMRRIEEQESLL